MYQCSFYSCSLQFSKWYTLSIHCVAGSAVHAVDPKMTETWSLTLDPALSLKSSCQVKGTSHNNLNVIW